jgi:hypothetical protein
MRELEERERKLREKTFELNGSPVAMAIRASVCANEIALSFCGF